MLTSLCNRRIDLQLGNKLYKYMQREMAYQKMAYQQLAKSLRSAQGSGLKSGLLDTALAKASAASQHFRWFHASRKTPSNSENSRPFTDIPKLGFKDQLNVYRKSYKKQSHNFHQQMSVKYGPLYRFNLGNDAALGCASPRAIEIMFRDEDKVPLRHPFDQIDLVYQEMRTIRGKEGRSLPVSGVFSAKGEDWQRQRSGIQKTFLRPKQLAAYGDGLVEVAGKLADILGSRRNEDGVVSDLMFQLTFWSFEGVLLVLCDKQRQDIDIDLVRMVSLMEDLQVRNEQMLYIPPRLAKALNLPLWKEYFSKSVIIYEALEVILRARIEEAKNDPASEGLIPTLMTSGLTEQEIVSGGFDMLIAGLDTTANASLFTLFLLSRHTEVQEKLRQEISEVCGQGELDASCLNNMHYIKAVVKESLRLYGPVPLNSRRFDRDIVLDGYNVPANTTVIYSGWAMGRSEKYFDSPLEFRPERWMKAKSQQDIDPFAFVPFGFGKRSCVGRRIAEMNMQLILVQLLRRYRISISDDYHFSTDMRFLLVSNSPVPLRFTDL